MKNSGLGNALVYVCLLFAFWVVITGYFDWVHLSMGLSCSVVVVWVNQKLKHQKLYQDDTVNFNQIRPGYAIYYCLWLFWQIILSAWAVTKIVINPKFHNQSCIVKFKVKYPNIQSKVILANSITLTPGTITLKVEGDQFTVHALSPDSYGGLVDDSMPRMVLGLYTKELYPVVSDVEFFHSSAGVF